MSERGEETTYEDAIVELFDEVARGNPADFEAVVQINVHEARWQIVPLEWNQAMRLADLSGHRVRILGRQGQTLRSYPEIKLLLLG